MIGDSDYFAAGYFVGVLFGALIMQVMFRITRCRNCCQFDNHDNQKGEM